MFEKPNSEADLLVQARWLLDLLERFGKLTYTRIHVGGMVFGGKLVKNQEMKGFADLEIVANGKVLYVELKSEKGTRSQEQYTFQERMERSGAKYLLCRRLEELVDALEEFGVQVKSFLKMKEETKDE